MNVKRAYAGWWTYRFGFTVIVFGYGLSIGLLREGQGHDEGERDWQLIRVFRNCAYRGLIRG